MLHVLDAIMIETLLTVNTIFATICGLAVKFKHCFLFFVLLFLFFGQLDAPRSYFSPHIARYAIILANSCYTLLLGHHLRFDTNGDASSTDAARRRTFSLPWRRVSACRRRVGSVRHRFICVVAVFCCGPVANGFVCKILASVAARRHTISDFIYRYYLVCQCVGGQTVDEAKRRQSKKTIGCKIVLIFFAHFLVVSMLKTLIHTAKSAQIKARLQSRPKPMPQSGSMRQIFAATKIFVDRILSAFC